MGLYPFAQTDLVPSLPKDLKSFGVWAGVTILFAGLPTLKWYLQRRAELGIEREKKKLDSSFNSFEGTVRAVMGPVAVATWEERADELCERILGGEAKTIELIDAELKIWAAHLIGQVSGEFAKDGHFIDRELGMEKLITMATEAVASTSPFPGKDPATALLNGGAKIILDRGSVFPR